MLVYMRALQEKFLPMPEHHRELAELDKIYRELLGQCGPRLRCLMDKQRALRNMIAQENFQAGFQLGWRIAKELEEVTDDGKTQTVRGRDGAKA